MGTILVFGCCTDARITKYDAGAGFNGNDRVGKRLGKASTESEGIEKVQDADVVR